MTCFLVAAAILIICLLIPAAGLVFSLAQFTQGKRQPEPKAVREETPTFLGDWSGHNDFYTMEELEKREAVEHLNPYP